MIYGERVKQAREYCGLTQTKLAKTVGVNQSAIAHIENGRNIPSEDLLVSIASQTGFLPPFFEREPIDDFSLGSLVYRARTSLTAREQAQAYQYAKVLFEHVKTMAERLNMPPLRLPRVSEEPRTAARVTRVAFNLSPDVPIRRLIYNIEKNGVFVLALPIVLNKLDAFSTWAKVEIERPVIAVSSGKSADRLRFSITHELGHLIMHQVIKGRLAQVEKDADKFAAEFLLPEKAMMQEINSPVTLTSIAKLKVRWGVSMQALIRRAHDLDIITGRQYRYLFEQLSSRGWRTKEPSNLDIPVEKPRLVAKMIEKLYGTSNIIESYANDMCLSVQRATELSSEHVGGGKLLFEGYQISSTQLQTFSRN